MAETENGESMENFAQMFASSEQSKKKLETGQKIKGKVIAVSGDDIFIDIG